MPNVVSTFKTMPRKLWGFLLSDSTSGGLVTFIFCLLIGLILYVDGSTPSDGRLALHLILAITLLYYVFVAFRFFVWLRSLKKGFGDFRRDVGLRFWSRDFKSRVVERQVGSLKSQIETSKTPAEYVNHLHTVGWQFNKLKRKLDGSFGEDCHWNLTFECAHQFRQALEAWWNGDRAQTKVVDWRRDGVTACIIVGPYRIQAAMVLMQDYQAFMALNDESVGKLLDQRFGLDTQSFHQIPMNDGGTHFLRVSDHPRRHIPPGGGKTKNPALPNLCPIGDPL